MSRAILRWRRSVVLAGTVATVGLLAGCAGNGASSGGPATAATGGPSAGAVDRSDPGRVAIVFTERMARADYTGAKELLDPGKYGILEALTLGASGAPGTTASGMLTAGRERITGDAGTVTLVGRLCRDPSAGNMSPDCIENTDPNGTPPAFTVHVKQIDGRWFVTFPEPSVTAGATQTH